MWAFGNERVAAKAVSTAALRSMPITSRAPQRAASCVCRPLPQPPSSTTLSRKNSGVTGAIQPRNCSAYRSSSCVKCCHCQPKPSAVARLSLSTSDRFANRGMPRVIGNDAAHVAQRSSPSMISSASDFATERSSGPSHAGQMRYCRSFCFKRSQYTLIAFAAVVSGYHAEAILILGGVEEIADEQAGSFRVAQRLALERVDPRTVARFIRIASQLAEILEEHEGLIVIGVNHALI